MTARGKGKQERARGNYVMNIALCVFTAAGGFLTLETRAAGLAELLRQCAPNVHPVTMGALVRHESGGNPYAILDNGEQGVPRSRRTLRSFRPKSLAEAVAVAKNLIAAGHVVDMGLGQVNSWNLKRLGLTVEQIFDPCTNLQATQAILANNYSMAVKRYGRGDEALYAALSAYNTGNFTAGLTNGYVREVLQAGSPNVPGLRVRPASFERSRMAILAENGGRAKSARPRPASSRKSQLLEAKLATIEAVSF